MDKFCVTLGIPGVKLAAREKKIFAYFFLAKRCEKDYDFLAPHSGRKFFLFRNTNRSARNAGLALEGERSFFTFVSYPQLWIILLVSLHRFSL